VTDKKTFPVQIYSELLKESFILHKNGDIVFIKSGVNYTYQEWDMLKGKSREVIKETHFVKTMFEGSDLERVKE
jgi:hypothetical protein